MCIVDMNIVMSVSAKPQINSRAFPGSGSGERQDPPLVWVETLKVCADSANHSLLLLDDFSLMFYSALYATVEQRLASLPPCSAVYNKLHEFLCWCISMRVNCPPVPSISQRVSCLFIPGYLSQVKPKTVQVMKKNIRNKTQQRGCPW